MRIVDLFQVAGWENYSRPISSICEEKSTRRSAVITIFDYRQLTDNYLKVFFVFLEGVSLIEKLSASSCEDHAAAINIPQIYIA